MENENSKQSRRDFVKQGTMLAGGIMAMPLMSNAGYFQSVDDTIKIVVIVYETKCETCCYG